MRGRTISTRVTVFATGAVLALAFAPSAFADFTVTGTFLYVDRAFTINGFTGVQPSLPIRLATVQVINNATSQVLATGSTDEAGAISIPVVGAGTADLVVRCFSRSNQFGVQSLRAVNASNIEYSVSSAVFPAWSLAANLDAGTITAQKVLSGSYQGGPFNMLDMLVHAIQYAKAQGSANPPSSVRVLWPGGGGSFASGTTATIADDDGFDDVVQLHEIGHVLHELYSNSDNPGGSHTFGDSDQDPRLSFGEGWASYFAGAVRKRMGISDPGFYLDCAGQGQTGGGSVQLRMRHETAWPYGGSTGGEADEGAVFCSLWDVIDTTTTNDGDAIDDDVLNGSITFAGGIDGDRMLWNVLVGPFNSAANSTIRNLWNGQFSPVDYGNAAQLATVYSAWDQRFTNDALEPNNTIATATPLPLSATWSATRTLYYAAAPAAAPGEGDSDHYALTVTAGSTFDVETRYPNGNADAETYCDTYLTLYRPNGTVFAQTDTGGAGRNAKLAAQVADASGTWVARVSTIHVYRKTGSYQIRAVLGSGPPGGCTNLAVATAYGVGKAGASGAPVLASSSPVIPSAAFTLTAAPAPPSASALLFLGVTATETPFDGGFLYLSPLTVITVPTSPAGSLTLTTPLSDVSTCGLTLHLQVMFPNDPGATGPYHTSQTNRLTLTFGG